MPLETVKSKCLWCEQEITIFPHYAVDVPHVWRDDSGKCLCSACIKMLLQATLLRQMTVAGRDKAHKGKSIALLNCAWCNRPQNLYERNIYEHLEQRNNDKVIVCHSCIKHLGVIVLQRENDAERRALKGEPDANSNE